MDPALAHLAGSVYRKMASAVTAHERLHYIADVFDEQDEQIWIDDLGHVTPEGNYLIAQKMLEIIQSVLND
jgi:hypothetical protein